MSYKIEVTSYFKRQAKRLLKKYPSLKEELAILFSQLEQEPHQGDLLGNNCFKVRLSIYDKSEQESLIEKELKALLYFI